MSADLRNPRKSEEVAMHETALLSRIRPGTVLRLKRTRDDDVERAELVRTEAISCTTITISRYAGVDRPPKRETIPLKTFFHNVRTIELKEMSGKEWQQYIQEHLFCFILGYLH